MDQFPTLNDTSLLSGFQRTLLLQNQAIFKQLLENKAELQQIKLILAEAEPHTKAKLTNSDDTIPDELRKQHKEFTRVNTARLIRAPGVENRAALTLHTNTFFNIVKEFCKDMMDVDAAIRELNDFVMKSTGDQVSTRLKPLTTYHLPILLGSRREALPEPLRADGHLRSHLRLRARTLRSMVTVRVRSGVQWWRKPPFEELDGYSRSS